MLDLIQAQKDLYGVLLSSAALRSINVVLQRQMQLKSMVDIATVWTTARNGCAGIGIIVEMPTANCDSPNISGPVLDWVFTVHVLENPQLNFAIPTTGRPAKGSATTAEQVVQMVLDEVHHYADDRLATFKAERSPVQPANIEGVAIGYRVSFSLAKGRSAQTLRTGTVQYVNAGGNLTLTCTLDPTASIWFTDDGSFPANDPALNPQSTLYSGAIPATPGTQVRARAYLDGKLGGPSLFIQL